MAPLTPLIFLVIFTKGDVSADPIFFSPCQANFINSLANFRTGSVAFHAALANRLKKLTNLDITDLIFLNTFSISFSSIEILFIQTKSSPITRPFPTCSWDFCISFPSALKDLRVFSICTVVSFSPVVSTLMVGTLSLSIFFKAEPNRFNLSICSSFKIVKAPAMLAIRSAISGGILISLILESAVNPLASLVKLSVLKLSREFFSSFICPLTLLKLTFFKSPVFSSVLISNSSFLTFSVLITVSAPAIPAISFFRESGSFTLRILESDSRALIN